MFILYLNLNQLYFGPSKVQHFVEMEVTKHYWIYAL